MWLRAELLLVARIMSSTLMLSTGGGEYLSLTAGRYWPPRTLSPKADGVKYGSGLDRFGKLR